MTTATDTPEAPTTEQAEAPAPDSLAALPASVLLALASAAKAAAEVARPGIAAGEYPAVADLHLRLTGVVSVGRDTTTTQVQAVSPWLLLRLALSRLNAATAEKLVQEAVTALDDGQSLDDGSGIKEEVEKLCGRLRKRALVLRKGAVKSKAVVKVVLP